MPLTWYISRALVAPGALSPKRADIYWFLHVKVLDEQYALSYHAGTIVKNDLYFVTFNLGFRIEPRIDYYFRQVVNELVKNGEVVMPVEHPPLLREL